MSEVAVFLVALPAAARAVLYVTSILLLLCIGGVALTLVVRALDRVGEAITADRDWQTAGGISKEETLLLISILIYAELLLSVEPPLRALAGAVGNVPFAALVLAPIAGAVIYDIRATARAGRSAE